MTDCMKKFHPGPYRAQTRDYHWHNPAIFPTCLIAHWLPVPYFQGKHQKSYQNRSKTFSFELAAERRQIHQQPKKKAKIETPDTFSSEDDLSIIDEWAPDLEKLKKELLLRRGYPFYDPFWGPGPYWRHPFYGPGFYGPGSGLYYRFGW